MLQDGNDLVWHAYRGAFSQQRFFFKALVECGLDKDRVRMHTELKYA